jgi:hypothetical protein
MGVLIREDIMREYERIDRILGLIGKAWKQRSDYRFGQLLINLGVVPDDFRLWNIEDDEWEAWFKRNLLVKAGEDISGRKSAKKCNHVWEFWDELLIEKCRKCGKLSNVMRNNAILS